MEFDFKILFLCTQNLGEALKGLQEIENNW